jgi:hypothetical protein
MHKGRPWQSVGVGVDVDKSSVIEGALGCTTPLLGAHREWLACKAPEGIALF